MEDRVLFVKNKGAEQQRCTVRYDEDVDLPKLRKALGMTPLRSKY